MRSFSATLSSSFSLYGTNILRLPRAADLPFAALDVVVLVQRDFGLHRATLAGVSNVPYSFVGPAVLEVARIIGLAWTLVPAAAGVFDSSAFPGLLNSVYLLLVATQRPCIC
jgi:hypothetical protein